MLWILLWVAATLVVCLALAIVLPTPLFLRSRNEINQEQILWNIQRLDRLKQKGPYDDV